MFLEFVIYKFIRKNDIYVNGSWSIRLNNNAEFLIHVSQPPYGVLIIEKESIHFYSDSVSRMVHFTNVERCDSIYL